MARRPDAGNKFIDAALKLAGETAWSKIKLSDIATAAKSSLSDLYLQFPDKTAILLGYMRRVDDALLSVDRSGDADLSARDRLFDVVMGRLEILGKDKDSLQSIAGDVLTDPLTMLQLKCGLDRSSRWMLQAAGIQSEGLIGRIRCHGLVVVMATLMPVWFRDDTKDLSPTMKALDQRLAFVERLITATRRPFEPREPAS